MAVETNKQETKMRHTMILGMTLAALATATAQPVAVHFSSLGLGGGPSARQITITPSALTALQTDGTNIITGGPIVLPPIAGGVTTNLWCGIYTVAMQGISVTWPMTVTTNFGPGPVPAVWFTTNLVWGGTNFGVGVSNAAWAAYATNAGTATNVGWSALPAAVLTNNISLTTNASLADSVRVVMGNIDGYGVNRFRWTNTIAVLATNGPFRLWMVGNGWAGDGEFAAVLTNLAAVKPFAGYGSAVSFGMIPTAYSYGQYSGNDTATSHIGDDTNWHQAYFTLDASGQITAPDQIVTSDVLTVSYLAQPAAGSFVVEIRTNGYAPTSFLQLDGTWITVGTINATGTRAGRVFQWTNTTPMPTQVRARSTSAGSTPILEFAQWNSRITNGIVMGMYTHGFSGYWPSYTDTNVVFPIWAAQAPTMVMATGGWDDSLSTQVVATVTMLRSGWPGADLVDIASHETSIPQGSHAFEASYCWSNGIGFFNGEAASADAWGSFSNGTKLGLYLDAAHLTPPGFGLFGNLVGAWLGLSSTYQIPAAIPANPGLVSTNDARVVILPNTNNVLSGGWNGPLSINNWSNNTPIGFDMLGLGQGAQWFTAAHAATNFALTGNMDFTALGAPAAGNKYGIYFDMGGGAGAKARLWYSGGLELGSYGAVDPGYGGLLANGVVQTVNGGLFAGNGIGLTNVPKSLITASMNTVGTYAGGPSHFPLGGGQDSSANASVVTYVPFAMTFTNLTIIPAIPAAGTNWGVYLATNNTYGLTPVSTGFGWTFGSGSNGVLSNTATFTIPAGTFVDWIVTNNYGSTASFRARIVGVYY